jgi:hypothetical protein
MKQSFSKKQHESFQKYFRIKNTPGEWDTKYLEKTQNYIKYIQWIPGIQMV